MKFLVIPNSQRQIWTIKAVTDPTELRFTMKLFIHVWNTLYIIIAQNIVFLALSLYSLTPSWLSTNVYDL